MFTCTEIVQSPSQKGENIYFTGNSLDNFMSRTTEFINRKSRLAKLMGWFFWWGFNTLRPRQNGRHFSDDIFKWIFLNENVWISIKISLKFVPRGPISNIRTLVQIMAWRRPGDKPLSEPMMVSLPTHICVARPQWVNILHSELFLRKICLRFVQYILSTLRWCR